MAEYDASHLDATLERAVFLHWQGQKVGTGWRWMVEEVIFLRNTGIGHGIGASIVFMGQLQAVDYIRDHVYHSEWT
jgi:hypothetical protein